MADRQSGAETGDEQTVTQFKNKAIVNIEGLLKGVSAVWTFYILDIYLVFLLYGLVVCIWLFAVLVLCFMFYF